MPIAKSKNRTQRVRHTKPMGDWEGGFWIKKVNNVSPRDMAAKKLFTKKSYWYSRAGRYQVLANLPEGIKIKYTDPKAVSDWASKHHIKFKTKQFITEGFEAMRLIDANIRKEMEQEDG